MPKEELITYVKKHNKPFGVVVAVKIEDKVYMGWSKCNKNDTFIRKNGRRAALVRADAIYRGKDCPYPYDLRKCMEQLEETAKEYFGIEVEKLEIKRPETSDVKIHRREEVQLKIFEMVEYNTVLEMHTIIPETVLYKNPMFDREDLEEILGACDEYFGIIIKNQPETIRTVKDLVDVVCYLSPKEKG